MSRYSNADGISTACETFEALEWGLLLAGSAALMLPTGAGHIPWLEPGGMLLMLAAFAMRWRRTRSWLPSTGLLLPWLVFILSALPAAFLALEPIKGMGQYSRFLAAFVLFCALAETSEAVLRRVTSGLLVGAALLALYFPLKHGFNTDPGKLAPVTALGLKLNAWLPEPPGPEIGSNVAGGVLAMVLPFGAAMVYIYWRSGKRRLATLAGALSLVVMGGLVMTSSRGALMGLGAALLLAGLTWLQRKWRLARRHRLIYWAGVGLAAGALLAGLYASGELERLVGMVPDPRGSLQSRLEIWRQGSGLLRDYLFTGNGLLSFPLTYSIYSLLIHVPFHEHMHNIFLETWYEQGVLGPLALLWGMLVLASSAWRALGEVGRGEATGRSNDGESIFASPLRIPPGEWQRLIGWAGLMALVAMGAHGLVDVIFYTKHTMPLVGVVTGVTAAGLMGRQPRRGLVDLPKLTPRLWAGLVSLILITGLLWQRPLLAAWYANLGALRQAHLELSRYNPDDFDNPSLDQIRRSSDLSQATIAFEKSLSLNPENLTALQRLAEIELSRGAYETALAHIESAWQAGKRDDVTRLLLGDVFIATGQVEAGVEVLRGLSSQSLSQEAEGRLLFQGWYRYRQNGDLQRAIFAWQAVLTLNPDNWQAARLLAEAQAR